MPKRYVFALSVAASALLLSTAGAAQAAEGDTATTTVTTTTGGEGSTTQTPRHIVLPGGRVATVSGTPGGHGRDTADSSWGG
ncbi:hypothetical protein [Streptomyces katrae]|uniref:Uncharacterized protein n=1 Tax=Streptomyces katrae TaxID=68223 RepID=A0A0F4IT48_9ACTN|nr:hypothetical protein [Streptomyces katrae]KJY24829.1 hypothetical protein VR44_34210 [Streptomyces katrae]